MPATDDAPISLDRHVTAEEAGQRLGVVLAGWLGISRSQAQGRVTRGLVTVDGEEVAKSHRVQEGERIRVDAPPAEPVVTPDPVPIRYADEHLAVVSKPADLVVHAGAGVRGGTLVDALRAQGVPLAPVTGRAAQEDRPGIVHRLDRGTSGLLVIAKTASTLAALQERIAAHDVLREYWALVEGVPEPREATIDAPIARSRRNRTTFVTSDDGRHAVSHYRVEQVHGDDEYAEVAVRLETGRTHQVRVHLSAIGRPVAGDVVYGASPDRTAALDLPRHALHARRLAFDHPVTGERIDVAEPLPDDLTAAVERAIG